MHVLIIEDNPDVQKALSLLLELHDIESKTASDPAAGLAMLAPLLVVNYFYAD